MVFQCSSAEVERAIGAHLAHWHGVVTFVEARALGLSRGQIQRRVDQGVWTVLHRGVYTLAGVPPSPEALTLAGCLAAGPGAVASHRSAAWLWGWAPNPPSIPDISVPYERRPRVEGVELHRRVHVGDGRRSRRGVPVTSALRTVVDLAAVVCPAGLDESLDVALSHKDVRVDQLVAVVEKRLRMGPQGLQALRLALERRGFLGAPTPSVLESRTLRLLVAWGYVPLAWEHPVGSHRVDFLLREDVVLEVDGFAFHSLPEAKARDSHRRNALRASGITVIETDWVTVTQSPEVLYAELRAILGPPGAGRKPGGGQ